MISDGRGASAAPVGGHRRQKAAGPRRPAAGLRTRVAVAGAAATALGLSTMAGLAYAAERADLRGTIDDQLTHQAEAVGEALGRGDALTAAVRAEPLGLPIGYAQHLRTDGAVSPLTSSAPRIPVSDRALAVAAGEQDRYFADRDIAGIHMRVLTAPVPGGAVQVAQPMETVDLHLLHIAAVLAALVVLGIGVASLTGRAVARAALRPVARLADEAEAIATPWTADSRLEPGGDHDLRRLARSVNTLLDVRDEAMRSQRQLVADASHELRTPLTSLRTNLQVLAHGVEEPEERDAVLQDLLEEVSSLSDTVQDLLELARELPDPALEQEKVALDDLVRESVAWTGRRHREVEVRTDLHPVTVEGSRSQFARLVGNLLDNAAKWSPPATCVDITLTERELTVRDHGPGIAADELGLVFERFYRSHSARGTPGSGLGLAIVRKVADHAGWTVQAEEALGGGALIRVNLRPGSDDHDHNDPARGDHSSLGMTGAVAVGIPACDSPESSRVQGPEPVVPGPRGEPMTSPR